MISIEDIQVVLRDVLQIGERASGLKASTPLLGSIPEFDSMAVVTVITMLEERYGIVVDDDEISADTFETLGTLLDFVSHEEQLVSESRIVVISRQCRQSSRYGASRRRDNGQVS